MIHLPPALAKLIPEQPDLLDMSRVDVRVILALRIAVISKRSWQDGRKFVGDRLGSERATTRFLIMVETMGQAWPENFRIGRPCCRQSTHDEMLMLQLLHCAAQRNRPAFDRLICEMVDEAGRDRLFADMGNFGSSYFPSQNR